LKEFFMQQARLFLGIASLLAFGISQASAQPITMFQQPGDPLGKSLLLVQESVQAELRMTDEQKTKFKELGTKQLDEFRRMFEQLAQGGNFAELRKKPEVLATEINKEAETCLNDDQKKRLHQIHLQTTEQLMGLYYVLRYGDTVAEELKITDEQKSKIQNAQDEMNRQLRDMLARGFSERDQEEFRKVMEKLTKEANKLITGLLDETQTRKLKDLKGEKFKGQVQIYGFLSKPVKPKKDKPAG
jgi:Spy/CpxP family protein refolding chaperone